VPDPPQPAQEPRPLVLSPGARNALTDTLPPAAVIADWEFVAAPLLVRPTAVGAPPRAQFKGLWRVTGIRASP
jgi:hypothetical protein